MLVFECRWFALGRGNGCSLPKQCLIRFGSGDMGQRRVMSQAKGGAQVPYAYKVLSLRQRHMRGTSASPLVLGNHLTSSRYMYRLGREDLYLYCHSLKL